MMIGCASTTSQGQDQGLPEAPTLALEPVAEMVDIPEKSSKATILKILTSNNAKGQEALDKLSSFQFWYKDQKEKENEMAR